MFLTYVGTAALGCPGERSSPVAGRSTFPTWNPIAGIGGKIIRVIRHRHYNRSPAELSLRQTAEGGCPYMSIKCRRLFIAGSFRICNGMTSRIL